MSKELYLSHLKMKLKSMPKEESDSAMYYVSEYFEEAGAGNEQKVIDELGTPERFAAQVKAEYALKTIQGEPQSGSTKSSVRNIILLILGIVSLPFSLPVVFALLVAMFVIGVLFFVMMVVFVVFIVGGGIAGVTLLWSGLTALFTNSPVGLVTTGTALLMLGVALLVFLVAYGIFVRLLPYCVSGLGKLFRKAKGKTI